MVTERHLLSPDILGGTEWFGDPHDLLGRRPSWRTGMTEHHLDDSVTHAYWDRAIDVRLEIESGDVVVVECAEPIGQVTPTWTEDDFARADPSLAHALGGAIYVKGARPGDTVEIDILKIEHMRYRG